ncbi:hypothetical protein RhiirA5_425519 [Rhizophagus irregularis]|uniref:Uncharacterized protein n=1 Tax=Rhizophagus irregularis TaxID=588596 RepID=A0A2N0P5X8_9GLOM|nr:hypothetical protein RhiirA5_425519 [Rhizophagus irregularis]
MYDVSKAPGLQTLADVMIMLCIRPAEIKTLRISNEGVTGYAKNRGQQDIPRLLDPGKPGMLWFNTFLKKNEFLLETGKPLLPSSLHKLGAVFAVISNCAKNLLEAMTITSEALRYSSDNHASPAKNYTIVREDSRGIRSEGRYLCEQEVIRRTEKLAQSLGLDEQNTRAYKALSGQIWALEKRLEDYHFEYVKLKRFIGSWIR